MPEHAPDELELAQLMCSRICHDLVGPVGAVNTAVELMAEDGDMTLDGDAAAVLERSVRDAGVRLTFYRRAFGLGGGEASTIGINEIRELVEAMMPADKVVFAIDVHTDTSEALSELPGYVAKLALILSLIGLEALPRGGDLGLHIAGLEDGIGLAVRAVGPGAAVRDPVRGVIERDPSTEITARNVHAHLAMLLAERLSATLELSSETDAIALATLIEK
ncbi:MAG: histidine phosphotransferase family protein [Rhodospirillales bacterium]